MIDKIYNFWFGDEIDEQTIIDTQSGLWWGKNVDTDLKIKAQFGDLYQLAINGGLEDWLQTTKGQLALIIVLDQFSRMIQRDNAAAFSEDHKALRYALAGINNNLDKSMRLIERVFYYMPLEHAEDIDIQNQCVALFQQLLFEAPETLKKPFQVYLEFAKNHQAVIARFSRFPHRNSILNRISSAEERIFLTQPKSSF